MTDKEAREIIAMIEGGWRFDMGPQGRELWVNLFRPYDAEQTTKAILELGRHRAQPPSFADVRKMILSIKSRAAAELPQEEFKRGEQAPEWVWVWSWARSAREPRETRPLPQQEGWGDPKHSLTVEEYKELREEWVKAGKPKAAHPIPAAL